MIIDIIQYLQNYIEPLGNYDYIGKYNQIMTIYYKINSTDNEIRRRLKLFVSRSPEYLKTIIQHHVLHLLLHHLHLHLKKESLVRRNKY